MLHAGKNSLVKLGNLLLIWWTQWEFNPSQMHCKCVSPARYMCAHMKITTKIIKFFVCGKNWISPFLPDVNLIAFVNWWRLAALLCSRTNCKSVALLNELNPHIWWTTRAFHPLQTPLWSWKIICLSPMKNYWWLSPVTLGTINFFRVALSLD